MYSQGQKDVDHDSDRLNIHYERKMESQSVTFTYSRRYKDEENDTDVYSQG